MAHQCFSGSNGPVGRSSNEEVRMKRLSALIIEGIVSAGPAQAPVGGVVVSARSGRSKRPGGWSSTDSLGQFRITLAIGGGVSLHGAEVLRFSVSRTGQTSPFHVSKPIKVSQLGGDPVRIEIPEDALTKLSSRPKVRVQVDGAPARTIGIGQ
jgi:hypothetical protein